MVMLNTKTYAPSSYVGSPRFTRMEKTARTTFSDGDKYPTTKEVWLLLTLRLCERRSNRFIDRRLEIGRAHV